MSSEEKPKKTWKRETAAILILYLGYTTYMGNVEMTEVLVWPIILFASAAFGMDFAYKQTDLVRK